MDNRVDGVVKWFSDERGYGFCLVEGDPDNTEYFVHYSSIEMEGFKTLKEKQPVTFVLKETDKGTQATEVKVR